MNATKEVTDNKNSSKKLGAQKPKKAKKISDERKLIKTLNKSFEDAKRKNAAIKKTMKDLSAVITEMLASPNEKMQSKLVKKLAFYGFNYADGALTNNVTSVKVKIPKIKPVKNEDAADAEKSSEKKSAKKLRKRKVSKDAIDVDSTSDVAVNAEVIDDVKSNEEGEVANLDDEHDVATEPSDEELAEIESEELDEDDDELDEELDDPTLDEDDRESIREARRVERDYERDCRSFAHEDIYQAMEDNGDFS